MKAKKSKDIFQPFIDSTMLVSCCEVHITASQSARVAVNLKLKLKWVVVLNVFLPKLSAYKVSLADFSYKLREKQQYTLLMQNSEAYFTIKTKHKPVPELQPLGQSLLLTSFSCLVELTGSGWFYVWSLTASYYPITSVHPSCPHAELHAERCRLKEKGRK